MKKLDLHFEIDAGLLKVQYQGQFFVHHALIKTGYGIVESEGT